MSAYFLLFNKSNGTLYDDTTYKPDSIEVIEKEITKKEIEKLKGKLNVIKKCRDGLDIAIRCLESTQHNMKVNKSIDFHGLNRVLEDILITVESVNEETFDITFINRLTRKTFKIDRLGENAYRNVFDMYDKVITQIEKYKFESHFVWRKIKVEDDENDKPSRYFKRSIFSKKIDG